MPRARDAHEVDALVPPGQTVVARLRRLDLGIVPRVPADKWDLRVTGAVEAPQRWTWEAFLALPQVRVTADFHCVTGWSRLGNLWEGVAFREVAAMARVKPSAVSAMLHCGEGYTTSLPLGVLLDEDVVLAHRLDGQPLPAEHGGPLRLVVPKRYAWKSAKWVRQIDLLEKHELGYWEVRGYSDTADPLTEDRYSL
jgi:DMSO/TMAO reductase YedYZ molybdopterin-dependent catalytic subunit